MKPFERILIATDFSPCADAAAAVAAQLAGQLHAVVHVVNVVDTTALYDAYGDVAYRTHRIGEIRGEATQRTEAFAARHFGGLEQVRIYVADGDTTHLEIIRAAQELGCDLIVMGTHGATGLAHLILGSVAEKVLHKSTVPVLAVRSPEAS
jgi:nucleotide-binding universal stress UspA family protein